MKKIIVANWKANLSSGPAEEWIQLFLQQYKPRKDVEIVLAVPFLFMELIRDRLGHLAGVSLAAQGVSPYPPGSYTGATPAKWLKGLAQYALLGHRERRRYFHETVQDVAAQVRECTAVGIRPVLCLSDEGITDMRAALDSPDLADLILAYTPDTAVALERVREPAGIKTGIARLSQYFPGRPVLYGGGVDYENGGEILALPEVGGIMLGRGCLEADKFAQIH